jgi:hypothetical protein
MGLGTPDHHPEHPTRFEGVRLPVSQFELREISTVLLLLEHGSLEKTLPNILATAALCRAIAIERGIAPIVRVVGENQLWNSMQGFGENPFTKDIQPGDHAVLVTAASLYRRQMAQLIGTFALSGATFDGYPHLVDDDVPLGRRDDPRASIRTFVETVTRTVSEPGVRELLRLAAESEREGSEDPVVGKARAALVTLQTTSFPWYRKSDGERPEIIPSVQTLITEWSDGAVIPSLCLALGEQHDEAEAIAASIWAGAEEIAPGIFQLIEFPYDETDEVVRERLRDLYTKDARARYVVERGADRPATSLSYAEAIAFERKLGAGEPPDDILREVEAIFEERNDRSCAVDLAMAELRDRDPKDTLETILGRAQYIPDPDGVRYTLLKHPERDWMLAFQQFGISMITHNALWIVDMKEGTARPSSIALQGQYLPRFLAMVEDEA